MSIKNKHREENEHKIFGMELGHLVEDAEKWWDTRGREVFRNRQFSGDMREQQQALDATNPVHPNYIGGKSGIMLGLPWIMLSVDERKRVIMAFTLTMKEVIDGNSNGTGSIIS